MIKNEAVLILDFGGQYSQLIARRVRDCNVFCEIKPYNISAEEIQKNTQQVWKTLKLKIQRVLFLPVVQTVFMLKMPQNAIQIYFILAFRF